VIYSYTANIEVDDWDDDDGDIGERLSDAIRGVDGVEEVEVKCTDDPSDELPEHHPAIGVITEVRNALFELEDGSALNCPLREQRDALDKLLGEDAGSVLPKISRPPKA